MNAPVSSSLQPGYTMIQGGQASLVGSSQLVGPTGNNSSGVLTGNLGIPAGGDIHICGSCSSQFTDIKTFLAHKRQGCHPLQSAQHSPQPILQLTGVGVPVGMPHVILQTSSGPPQMYRIVLEPSLTSTPAPPTTSRIVLEPTLSSNQTLPCSSRIVLEHSSQNHSTQITSSVTSVPPSTFLTTTSQTSNAVLNSIPQDVNPSQSTIQTTPILTQSLSPSQNPINVTDSSDPPHPSSSNTSPSSATTTTISETESQYRVETPVLSDPQIPAPCVSLSPEPSDVAIITPTIQRLSQTDTDVTVGRSSAVTGTSNSIFQLPHVSWASSPVIDKVHTSEKGQLPSTSSLHTEEEDVATFLATQLASQAGAIPSSLATVTANTHSGVVSEQIQPSVISSEREKSPLKYASVPTQSMHNLPHGSVNIKKKHNQPHYQIDNVLSNGHVHLIKHYNSDGSYKISQRLSSETCMDDPLPVVEHKRELPTRNHKNNTIRMQEVDRKKEKACPVKECNFTTCHNKDLSRHIRKHTGEKPYHCIQCGKCFTRGDKLKVHMRIHSNVRPYWCQEPGCQYRAIDSGSLKKHMRIHTDERPYKCQLCLYSARDGSQLTVHLRTHTGDTPFQCMVENCSAAFKTSSDLRRHERLHTGVKPYKCSECDYACAIKSNLTVHIRLNHFQGAKFSCSRCDFVANNRKQLKDHEKSHSETLLHCEICQHITTSTTSLRQHMLLHSQEKPFQCRYCSFACKTTGNLRYHVRNKHGCDVSKISKKNSLQILPNNQSSSKIRNSSSNGGGRKYSKPNCYRSFKCGECGSGFVREDSYRSHVRQHEKHKMSQTIGKLKMNSEMLSVVVQDGIVMESSEGDGEMSFQTIERTEDSLHTERLHESQTVVANNSAISESNNVDNYNSYVITIDGISTVFSNPVRLTSGTVTNHSGQELSGTVQVITGNLTTLNQTTNKESNSQQYPLTDENKISAQHHLYNLDSEVKIIKQSGDYNERNEQQISNSSNDEFIKQSVLDSNAAASDVKEDAVVTSGSVLTARFEPDAEVSL